MKISKEETLGKTMADRTVQEIKATFMLNSILWDKTITIEKKTDLQRHREKCGNKSINKRKRKKKVKSNRNVPLEKNDRKVQER